MFKLLYTNLAGPLGDINVSSLLVAEAGMVGVIQPNSATLAPEVQLYTSGISTTDSLVGIIDDQKTSSFTATTVGEVVVSGQSTLMHANIVGTEAELSVSSTTLSPSPTVTVASFTNGTITVAGVSPNDNAVTVSYSYVIPGKAGDDTTLASGKCTLWLAEGEYTTDIIELASNVPISGYSVGTTLYSADNANGQAGRLTTRSAWGSKVVGYVTKAPTAGNPVINFFKHSV